MKDTATVKLVEELVTREGVKEIVVEPYEKLELKGADPIEGPARVLVIID